MQTSPKQDIRSWAALPSHKDQLTGQIYVPDKHGGGVEAIVRSIRPGSIIEVVELHWLAGPGRADKRRRQLVKHVDTIEERGGRIREVSTGDETPRHKTRMLMRAYEKLSRSHSATSGRKGGRPPRVWTAHENAIMEGAWHRRSNKNNDERLADMRKRLGKEPLGATALRLKYGPPGSNAPDIASVPFKSERKKRQYVYFFRDGDKIKIGHSNNPTRRMNHLKTHSPLELLGVMGGGPKREASLHRKFAEFRIEGTREWFVAAPQIIAYVKRHKLRREN